MGALCTRGGGDVDDLVGSGMKLFWNDAGKVAVVVVVVGGGVVELLVGTALLVALGGAPGEEALST